ncbi:hypothetical protein Tco_1081693 [Tanacetum coccineum]|uniref:Uncharacterized protein n=1 Tax=Tanacetum coccineum TaxID=301880 RepID=A0ABQ5HYB2_9ASTR
MEFVETVNEETHIAEPNNYITATRKNFVSNNNEGRMVEKCIVEIQGQFLEKIRNDAFNGNKGETHTNTSINFSMLLGQSKLTDIEEEEVPNETNNAPEIFMIEGNLFDFETPLCEAFNEFNCLLKIDIDLFTYDIQDLNTYNEYEQGLNNDEAKGMVRVGSMTYFQEHEWYDELADGKLKDETIALKSKIEGSWGDVTPGVLKFCKWLKSCFENFHEIEYEVLYRETGPGFDQRNNGNSSYPDQRPSLEESLTKFMAESAKRHEENSNIIKEIRASTDAAIRNQGALIKTMEIQVGHMGKVLFSSNCKVRRFEMMKYSFNDDEEYITIKEFEYLNHSKDSLGAYQELLRLIDDGWVVMTPDDE